MLAIGAWRATFLMQWTQTGTIATAMTAFGLRGQIVIWNVHVRLPVVAHGIATPSELPSSVTYCQIRNTPRAIIAKRRAATKQHAVM